MRIRQMPGCASSASLLPSPGSGLTDARKTWKPLLEALAAVAFGGDGRVLFSLLTAGPSIVLADI